MSFIEALFLGLVQGLTEFLPVSSSGHLTIGKEFLNITTDNLAFEVVVHAATVLSTIVVFRREIWSLISGFFKFKYNSETSYILKIGVSMIPVFIVGIFFKDFITSIFASGLLVVGVSLLITSMLLFLTNSIKKTSEGEVTYLKAFIIGIAQAFAVLPGISRSGATISVGLLVGVDKERVAKFSFLMVLIPILGETFLELISGDFAGETSGIDPISLFGGFVAAFAAGLFACKTMIALVKRVKLTGFAIYCLIIGVGAILYSLIS